MIKKRTLKYENTILKRQLGRCRWTIRQMKADLYLLKKQLLNISNNIQPSNSNRSMASIRYYPGGKVSRKVKE